MISVESFLRNHKPVDASVFNKNDVKNKNVCAEDDCSLEAVNSHYSENSVEIGDCEENSCHSSYRLQKYNSFNNKAVKKVDSKKACDFDSCKECALRMLDYASRSSNDLKNRLIDKGYRENIVESVIIRLEDLHLIDDEQYAQSVIRSCISRTLGERPTRMELQKKGVASAIITSSLQDARENGVFEQSAWSLGKKVAQRTKNLEPDVRRRRFFSAGARKGHDLSTLNEVYYALFKS